MAAESLVKKARDHRADDRRQGAVANERERHIPSALALELQRLLKQFFPLTRDLPGEWRIERIE